ncbi:uncharacterized protein LOC143445375 isoform X1 [Clavelina lepadiformis]|uniref:uncharacterized protein LOC143445375 isoform X1 n=2 Tax=Clavelina lepadiformis TaxID=159417 RepID=UPI0040434B41
MITESYNREKRSSGDLRDSSSSLAKLPKLANDNFGEAIHKSTTETTMKRNHCYVTHMESSLRPSIVKSEDSEDSVENWLKARSDSAVALDQDFGDSLSMYDAWENVDNDSDDEDFNFVHNLQLSPSEKSFGQASVFESEGYGTDTSDISDAVTPSCTSPDLSKANESPKASVILKKISVVRPKIITIPQKLIVHPPKSNFACSKKCDASSGPGQTTKVCQVSVLKSIPCASAKVDTSSRKTVVVRVIKPNNNGFIKVRKTNKTMGSRLHMKMQLQRDKAILEEDRNLKKTIMANNSSSSMAKNFSTSAINFPSFKVTKPELPSQILKVDTELQNPTAYHVRATQLNQVKEYLSQSHDGSKYIARQMLAPPSSAPTGGTSDYHGSTPASPLARLNISTSADNLATDSSVTDIIDDIVSLESSYEDPTRFERPAATLPSISSSEMDRFTQHSSTKLPVIIRETTSSSCPVIKPEYTEEDLRLYAKDRIKKDNHNIIERRRRYNINDRIKELGQLVPKSIDPDVRWNKGSILKAAVDYILAFQQEQTRYKQIEIRNKQMEAINKKLLLRVQELETTLHQNGVNLPNDSSDKQQMVNTIFNNSTTVDATSFTTEEEIQLSNFPSNPISPPSVTSSVVMVTQQQGGMQSDTPTSSNLMTQQVAHQQYQSPQLLTVEGNVLGEQQHHLSPNPSYNQLAYSPHSSTTSPQAVANVPQTSTDQNVLGTQGLMDMDLSQFTFNEPTSTDIQEGGFSALLQSDNANYEDVIMDDGTNYIKHDIFLSDATNPTTFANMN